MSFDPHFIVAHWLILLSQWNEQMLYGTVRCRKVQVQYRVQSSDLYETLRCC